MAKTKRPYKQKSPEKVKEEINRLTEGMEKSITNHFHSPEQMKEYLDFMGKFIEWITSGCDGTEESVDRSDGGKFHESIPKRSGPKRAFVSV